MSNTNELRAKAHWPPGWNAARFVGLAGSWLPILRTDSELESIRRNFLDRINARHFETYSDDDDVHDLDRVIVRDCARAWRGILHPRSERLAGFSVLQGLVDVAAGRERPDLGEGFWAEVCHLLLGLEGLIRLHQADSLLFHKGLSGREAAVMRSAELDRLSVVLNQAQSRFAGGLDPDIIKQRRLRVEKIRHELQATEDDWLDWRWHIRNLATGTERLSRIANITDTERRCLDDASAAGIPVAVTPYYASLFGDEPGDTDRAVRAQVIPPESYVRGFTQDAGGCGPYDFMRESDTSPVDLVTRRYAAIAILKPLNTCPQICVYCQRNWEIESPESSMATSGSDRMENAVGWLRNHPGIHEVLVTGGDPLMMDNRALSRILKAIAQISHVERIRIGTRTPVTLPMRIDDETASMLGSFRIPGVREICLMTHVEHPSEVTPDFVEAVSRLRDAGVPVYNQLVYTFFVSRRFEAACLRRLLRRSGVDPYYTFYPKGKRETAEYRVPIARLLQEQKEESRLLPGLARTDEAVYNVPGLGKNYLNSWQHRDLISIRPDGARVYEFHPWEKKISSQDTWVGEDVPIIEYLSRLASIGEDPSDYDSIWYYF